MAFFFRFLCTLAVISSAMTLMPSQYRLVGGLQFDLNGLEPAGHYEEMEAALTDYCEPLGNCDKWRYAGFGNFHFKGRRPPRTFELMFRNETLPVIHCSGYNEPPAIVAAMKRQMTKHCAVMDNCKDWFYRGCGIFRYDGTHRYKKFPFVLREMPANVTTLPVVSNLTTLAPVTISTEVSTTTLAPTTEVLTTVQSTTTEVSTTLATTSLAPTTLAPITVAPATASPAPLPVPEVNKPSWFDVVLEALASSRAQEADLLRAYGINYLYI